MPIVEVYGEKFEIGMDAISLQENEAVTDFPGVKDAIKEAAAQARKDGARYGESDAAGDASDSASDATADGTGNGADGSTYTREEVKDVVQRMRNGDPDAHKEFQQIKHGTVAA